MKTNTQQMIDDIINDFPAKDAKKMLETITAPDSILSDDGKEYALKILKELTDKESN